MKLRIQHTTWERLKASLLANQELETAAVLLAEPMGTAEQPVLVVREALLVPEKAYLLRKADQISIDPVAMNRMTRPARDRNWSVITLHTHPGASEPWFSQADDAGDSRLMPAFARMMSGAPHGSMVLIPDGRVVGRTFDQQGVGHPLSVIVVGEAVRRVDTPRLDSDQCFSRQELALGKWGQAQLQNARVGVIGLGGIGSQVALQLAHLGVGSLVLIDGDLVEASNLSRLAGACPADIGAVSKAEVAGRYARTLGLVGQIECHDAFFSPEHADLATSCDLIISCVDRQTPRALLNRLAYQTLLPVIDLGTAFRVDGSGRMTGAAGRVVVLGPGRPCLACWGHLDADRLRNEALSTREREEEIREGYIDGADEPQPSVIAFNTMVAGAGVVEALRLLTSFTSGGDGPLRLAFSFMEGTVKRNALFPTPGCRICGQAT
jgi:proteasome lid subunit RPN8/RPN11